MRHVRRDRRDDLHGGGARADDGDALAPQVDVVIPARGVDRGPREGLDARDVGALGLRQHARRADDVPRGDLVAVAGLQPPEVLSLVERRARHTGAEPQPLAQAVGVDAVLGVRAQLMAGRVHARPVRALAVGELVAEGRDVHRDARVRVPVPGTADPVALFDDEQVLKAGATQRDRRADAGEATAHDDDLVIGKRHVPVLSDPRAVAHRPQACGRWGGRSAQQPQPGTGPPEPSGGSCTAGS